MKESIWERYGPYPKKKEKKKIRVKEGGLLKRSYNWFTWKAERIGEVTFYHPCLEH